jgi:hypothetical protein
VNQNKQIDDNTDGPHANPGCTPSGEGFNNMDEDDDYTDVDEDGSDRDEDLIADEEDANEYQQGDVKTDAGAENVDEDDDSPRISFVMNRVMSSPSALLISSDKL